MTDKSRREFMITAGAGAVGMLVSSHPVFAASKKKVVKVGISLPASGLSAPLGNSLLDGVRLYDKYNQSRLPDGVSIEVIFRDDEGSSDKIKRIARELIAREHVQILGGVAISPQAFALAPLVTKAKIPLVVMNASTANITRKSPYIVRTSHTNWQTSYTLGKWVYDHDYRKAYTMVSDYAAGHDSENAFTTGFSSKGGSVVGSVRTPMDTIDFLPYMEGIKSSGADTLYVFINAGHMNAVAKAFANSGLKDDGVRLIGPGYAARDDDIAHMGEDIVGTVTAAVYYVNNPVRGNREFLKEWHAEHGEDSLPNYESASAWDSMGAIHDLVRATGGDFDTPKAMEFLSHWKDPDSSRGLIHIDPQTRDVVENIYINRVEMVDGTPTNVNIDKVEQVKDPWKKLNPKT